MLLTDHFHIRMVGNGLEGRRLRRDLASVTSRAHEIHGRKDDRPFSGIVNLKKTGELNFNENWFYQSEDVE